ncbi:MAG: MFS transporter [Bryobacteraceae bacterium]
MNPRAPWYKWLLVAFMFFVAAIYYGDRTALSAVYPLLRKDLGLSDIELGLVGSAFLWTFGLGSPFAGYLSDRFSRARIVMLSLAAWSVATLLVAFVRDLRQLMWARALLGITECFYTPAALALIADHHGPSTRGAAIGINLAGMSFGMITAGTVAGYVAESQGWRPAFLYLGGIGIAIALIGLIYVRDGESHTPAKRVAPVSLQANFLTLFRTRTYMLVLTESMLNSAGVWMFWNWLPLYYQETFGLSLAGAGFSGTFMLQSAAALGIMTGGYASDRWGKNRPSHRPLVMSICYFVSAPFLLAFSLAPTYAVVSACVFLFSLIRSFGQAAENPMLCDVLPKHVWSSAMGLLLTSNVAAGSVSILFAAWIKGLHGLGFAFSCISGIVIVAAFLGLAACRSLPGDMARLRQQVPEASAVRG